MFFAITATLSVLSYFHARKTLFSPLRTETFKLQLKVFEELLAFFQNKSEHEFKESLDLQTILALNTMQMADYYISQFFPDELVVDDEKRTKARDLLVGAIVSKAHAEKYFRKAELDHTAVKQDPKEKKITNPAIILANWQKYEHGMVSYTQVYEDRLKDLGRLAASPLLPRVLREHLGDFQQLCQQNLVLIGKTITECAHLMPEHFPTASDMKDFTPDWVWNHFNGQSKPLQPTAKKILDYLNLYLKVEDIMAA